MGLDTMVFIFWMLSFKTTFSPSTSFPFFPLTSSRDSLVPLHFLPLKWCHLHIWGCWYFSQQSWFLGLFKAVFCCCCFFFWHFFWLVLLKVCHFAYLFEKLNFSFVDFVIVFLFFISLIYQVNWPLNGAKALTKDGRHCCAARTVCYQSYS